MKRITTTILILLTLFLLACNNNNRQTIVSSNDSIILQDTIAPIDSNKMLKPQPHIVSFYQSECQGNCKATRLVIGKVLSNDTLYIRLASYFDCQNKYICNIEASNDTLKFNISLKPKIIIIKNKGKYDTIYEYKSHFCDCFYFFDITIAGINKIPKKFLLNGSDDFIGGMVISDTVEFKIEEEYDEYNDTLPPPFIVVEEMPTFPGGNEARMKFMTENLVYPPVAFESKIQGTVYVTFVVEPDGTLTNIKILRGIGGGCDEEAIRIIKMMPKWNPGKQSGKNVRVQFNFPIKFIL